MTLYEIDSSIRDFPFETDDNGEILNFDDFDALQIERERKIENIALYIKELDAEAAAIKAEADALDERKKEKEKKRDGLKSYLKMSLCGQKFETARCSITYRKSKSVSVGKRFIEWAKEHAPELISEKIEISANKTAIKEAINSGRKIVGAEIVENHNLIIK